jgi:hypothetical protein
VDLASIRSRLCSHVDLALACGAPGSNNVQVPRRVVHGMQGALTELGFLPARLKSLS